METGVCASLFDFKFEGFVTPRIIKMIYWVVIILICLAVFVNIITSFAGGMVPGIITLIVAPLVGFLLVMAARVYLEIIMVLFRIMGLLEGMAEAKGVSIPNEFQPTPTE